MRIGIDARLYGPEHTGLGRYITKLVDITLQLDKENTYVLFVTKNHRSNFTPSKNLEVVEVNIPVYSFGEQIVLPFHFLSKKLDLLHVPHFNAPLLYPRKFILTIHDLIKHESTGPNTTTRTPWIYWLKRLGYHFLLKTISRRATKIIVPSNFVKNDLISKLKIKPQKITVTYEAVSGSIKKTSLSAKSSKSILQKYKLSQPFLMYTGNIYPHKNVEVLIDALQKHNIAREVDLQLGVVCARSVFWDRLNNYVAQKEMSGSVRLLGFLDDYELSKLYSLALALVHPSKMEGFGLTGLEAMSVGLPVIAANASCLPEVYGSACLYFDPNSSDDLAEKLRGLVKDESLRKKLIEAGLSQSKKYSWTRMVKETLELYKQV